MIPSYYEFINTTKIISGKCALENIPFELKCRNAKRPIILTNDMLLKLGLTDVIIKSLGESDIVVGAVYKDIPQDSSIKIISEILKIYKDNKCDSIIAVGGGSVIDTAKGLNVLIAENSSNLMEFLGVDRITRHGDPFIVVPTTAGTGSEVTTIAVISDTDKNVKLEFQSSYLLPDVAVLDERMTESLPPKITASTGMDALCHAIEGYTCIQKNPLSDAYAYAAIKIIMENLVNAVKNGKDKKARLAMANASLMAGVAFSNSMVGIVHAMAHACGGVCHVPHGDAVSILLPYGMEYNVDKYPEYFKELLLPLAGEKVYAETPNNEKATKTVVVIKDFILNLNELCGLPMRLRDAGVRNSDIENIAKKALNDGAVVLNEREPSLSDIVNILQRAF